VAGSLRDSDVRSQETPLFRGITLEEFERIPRTVPKAGHPPRHLPGIHRRPLRSSRSGRRPEMDRPWPHHDDPGLLSQSRPRPGLGREHAEPWIRRHGGQDHPRNRDCEDRSRDHPRPVRMRLAASPVEQTMALRGRGRITSNLIAFHFQVTSKPARRSRPTRPSAGPPVSITTATVCKSGAPSTWAKSPTVHRAQREAGPSPQPASDYGLNFPNTHFTPTVRSAER
jgi:hypothetical protein